MHIQNQIDYTNQNIKELETTLKRRLQALMEKAAVYGLGADPSITIEIEDIQEYFKENNDGTF